MNRRPELKRGAICRWSKHHGKLRSHNRNETILVSRVNGGGDGSEGKTRVKVWVFQSRGQMYAIAVYRRELWFTVAYGKLPEDQGKATPKVKTDFYRSPGGGVSITQTLLDKICVCSIDNLMGGCPSNRGLKCKSK